MAHFGGAVIIPRAQQATETRIANQILIFSLLNVRKKTAAVIAGIFIGAASLWGLSIWQNISRQEILSTLLASVVMLGSIIIAALILIAAFKRETGSLYDGLADPTETHDQHGGAFLHAGRIEAVSWRARPGVASS